MKICWTPKNEKDCDVFASALSKCYKDPELPDALSQLICSFVFGPFSFKVSVKGYGLVDTPPKYYNVTLNQRGEEFLNQVKQRNPFSKSTTVFINRITFRRLKNNQTLFQQNVFPDTPFEMTRHFEGRGNLIEYS